MGNIMSKGSIISDSPQHSVTLDDYEIGKYEVTVKEYRLFCNLTGREMPVLEDSTADNHPITRITWYDAVEYCQWLSKETGATWRLPTEAEWEYAAKGGIKSENYLYSGSDYLDEVGAYNPSGIMAVEDWENGSISSVTFLLCDEPPFMTVGSKFPNELGIYDMSGNVREWCSDWYDSDYYKHSPEKNPQGADNGTEKVVRGGNWENVCDFLMP